ncbi:MAG: hypothetical protein HY266_09330 [Deltaproteobacteria bacterium]|nr:hypothetical protein [Deltaproteobacteria bacterium]
MKSIKRWLLLIIFIIPMIAIVKVWALDYDMSAIDIHAGTGPTLSVDILLIDPLGRKTGVDAVTNEGYLDIPKAGYAWDEEPGINPRRTLYHSEAITGIYTLRVSSKTTTTYWVYIWIEDRNGNKTIVSFDGFISSGRISEYKIDYKLESGAVQKVERVVTVEDLKNDVNIAFNLGLIDNDGIKQSLLVKLDAAENSIKRGQKQAAKNQLNAFINEVNAQKDKHIKGQAVDILINGAQYIASNL